MRKKTVDFCRIFKKCLLFNFWQVGGDHTFDMFSYICGDVTPLLGGCDEDVVVMSHTEKPTCGSYDGRHGDVIYANSGSLFRETEQGLSVSLFLKVQN